MSKAGTISGTKHLNGDLSMVLDAASLPNVVKELFPRGNLSVGTKLRLKILDLETIPHPVHLNSHVYNPSAPLTESSKM